MRWLCSLAARRSLLGDLTPNGRYAYTTKVSSSSVSSYHIDHQGALSLVAAKVAVMPAGNDALDMATPPDEGNCMCLLYAH